ncbi:MAG: transglycosylase SLT domain-containing protein [Candidatus Magasanikbacteria bacterium]
MKFGRKEGALLGALLAGGVGCADGEVDAKRPQDLESDSANVKIYDGEEDVVNLEDDAEFGLPDDEGINRLYESTKVGDQNEPYLVEATRDGDVVEEDSVDTGGNIGCESDIEENLEKENDKSDNYLLKEMDKSLESLPGFDKEAEVKRIVPKLANGYSKKIFNHLPVLMERYFKHLIQDKEYREKVKNFVEKYCEKYGVPISVVWGVIGVESGGDNDLISHKQAHGIFQVKQVAADHLREIKFNGEDWRGIDIDDLEDNIRVGVAYLSYMHKRFGQWGLALSAYNTGPRNFQASIISRLNKYNNDRYSVEKRKNKLAKPPQRITKEMIKKYPGGWPAFLRDHGIDMVSACSKKGLKTCEYGYGGYPFNAMFLAKTVQEIFENGDQVEIVPITDNFN